MLSGVHLIVKKTHAIDNESLGLNANGYKGLLGYQNITINIDCKTFVHSATVAEVSDCTSMAKRFASQPGVKEGDEDQLTKHDRGRGSNAAPGRKRRTVQAIENFFQC
jgi:hypothetical protein